MFYRKRIERLEKKVKQLECKHENTEFRLEVSYGHLRFYEKYCKDCGKVVDDCFTEKEKLKEQQKEIQDKLKEL